MLAIAYACALVGLEGRLIEVQVDYNPRAQLPSFSLVGLPDSAVRESRDRVKSAIKNSRLQFPNKGYLVNLAPADLPKHGPAYDLAIAMGVLAVTDQVPLACLEKTLFVGELMLDGRVRHVQGALPMAHAARQAGFETIVVPKADAQQAAFIKGLQVIPVETLGELVEHLYDLRPIEPCRASDLDLSNPPQDPNLTDFADIKGQEHVKRALEIAAAGGHNLRMVGPPGAGKSLLARAMPGILPHLTMPEALEITRIYSVADMLDAEHPLVQTRPFQAPHHTISQAGLVGGGSIAKPGAVSLSHRGVLFLDEINEFSTKTLEVMRQPMEDKQVTISRAKGSVTFPANFMLVAAHNPCPCGHYGDATQQCTCTPTMITRYQAKLSGPLLDRIDLHVEVPRVPYDKLMSLDRAESSAQVRARVVAARQRQTQRFDAYPHIFANADMGTGEVQDHCILKDDARQLLELSVRKMKLSARSYHRVLKISRTIADLAASDAIAVVHIAEALQYRPKHQAQA